MRRQDGECDHLLALVGARRWQRHAEQVCGVYLAEAKLGEISGDQAVDVLLGELEVA